MKLQIGNVVVLLNQLSLDMQNILDSSLPNKQQNKAAVAMMQEKFVIATDKVTTTYPNGLAIEEDSEGCSS